MENVLDLSEWFTIRQGAQERRVTEAALRMYLRLHRDTIETRKVGATVLIRRQDLVEKYTPREQ